MKNLLTGGRTPWRGVLLLVAFSLLSWLLLKLPRLIRMNTINDTGWAVLQLLVSAGFSYDFAKIIVCQAAHESDNFSSDVFKKYNNCFGMRTADNSDYEKYTDLKDCVNGKRGYRAYYLRHSYLSSYNNILLFVTALKDHRYFTAPLDEYIKGVTHFYKLYFNG